MDSQRDAWAPGGAIDIDSGTRQRDWLRIDRGARETPGARIVSDPAQDALTRARLLAWVEQLRGAQDPVAAQPAAADRVDGPAAEALEFHPAAGLESELMEPRQRGIPASALVPVGRGAAAKPQGPAPPPRRPALPAGDVPLPRWGFRLRAAPRSPALRFILLCLAAFFLAAGVAHSFARWKPARVIVVPATHDARSVIT